MPSLLMVSSASASRIARLLFLTVWAGTCCLTRVQAAPLRSNYSGVHAAATQVFHTLRLLNPGVPSVRSQILPPASSAPPGGAVTVTGTTGRSTQAVAPLSFTFTGFTTTDQAVLSNFLRLNYATFVEVYGDPSPSQQGKTVTVIGNGAFQNAYSPPADNSAGGGNLYYTYREDIDPNLRDNFNRYNFSRLVLGAFHGRRTFAFNYAEGQYIDAWERGFADAAALLVAYKSQGSPANFDPSLLGSYVLPVYDLLNRPNLGNASFFPLSGDDLVVGAFRVAMAQSAWLKVAVENPSFFSTFNSAYYAAWNSDGKLASDVPGLERIAAGVVPTVEGLGFNDWYRRQQVLNTSVTTGQKLYVATLPFPNATTGDTRSGFQAYAQWFTTVANGGETGNTGMGSDAAFDENGNDISSKSVELSRNNILQFGSDSTLPGQAIFGGGFAAIGTPDQARITLRVRAGTAEATSIFPYNVAGTVTTSSRFYGAIASGSSGGLILNSNGKSANSGVLRGAWTSALAYPSAQQVRTTFAFNGRSYTRNTAWLVPGSGARSPAFILDGTGTTDSVTLSLAAGSSNLRMISVPIYPTASDEATVLGLPASSLQLARYRPNLSPTTFASGALTFGVGSDRHELYAGISEPMSPGRGYWLTTATPYQKVIPGELAPLTKPFVLPLAGGWNQIGVPFNRSFAPGSVKVGNGGFAAVSFDEAVLRGWISPGIWRWQVGGGYARVDVSGGAMAPFEGCYIFCPVSQGVFLSFDPTVATLQSARAATAISGWAMRLTAGTATAKDNDNTFGIAAVSHPAGKPPAAAKVVSGHFTSSGNAVLDKTGPGAASGWADSFQPDVPRQATWAFVVDGTNKDERVTLTWPMPQGLPDFTKLWLTDRTNGAMTKMRMSQNYSYVSTGAPRQFTILYGKWAAPTVKVSTSLSAPVTFTVTSNIVWTGELAVRQNGETVRILRQGAFPAGVSSWTWDRRNATGAVSPPGWYNVTLVPDAIPSQADDIGTQADFQLQ